MRKREIFAWLLAIVSTVVAIWPSRDATAVADDSGKTRPLTVKSSAPRSGLKPTGDRRQSPEPVMAKSPDSAEQSSARDVLSNQIANVRAHFRAEREKRKAEMLKMSEGEKAERRERFIAKLREKTAARFRKFVDKAGLSEAKAAEFEDTLVALSASVRESAQAWANQINASKSFTNDDRMRFVAEMSTLASAGYQQMDDTLTSAWRGADGDLNLLQMVGGEALAPVVEVLMENEIRGGMQTIGMLMGGPDGDGAEQAGEGEPGGDPGTSNPGGPEGGLGGPEGGPGGPEGGLEGGPGGPEGGPGGPGGPGGF